MDELKLTIAKNIADLRKQRGMTQLQLAEQLNYSDKAVSKWERGESIPDIYVLIEIANVFSVSLDHIVTENPSSQRQSEAKTPNYDNTNRRIINNNKKIITAISIQAVWLVALLVFVPLAIFFPESDGKWLSVLYAVPVSAIVWLIFNSVWFNRRRNYLIISVLMWTLLAAVHITLLMVGASWHLIYLLGIPGELIIVLWSAISRKPTDNR